jgi:spermidine synthase
VIPPRGARLHGKIMKRLDKGLANAIEIVEEDGVRVLQIGGNAIQSAMRLDAPDRIELDYVRAMLAFVLFHPDPREVLLVGLGGGSMARFIHQRMRQTRVTVVEIDPGVVSVARRYFHFPEEDRRLEIVIGDGAEVVPRRPASCDVLVVDGFVNGSPAKDLCAQSFYGSAFAALRPGGVMVANFMSDDKRMETYCRRIEESFGRNPTLLLAEEEDNLIAFAVRGGPPRIAWAELKARSRAARRLLDLPLEGSLADLRRRNSHTTQFLTL